MSKTEKAGNAEKISDLIRPGILNTNHPYAFDFKNSLEIIRNAVEAKTPITIIGDYDCDGVCASAVMAMALRELGCEPKIRIPKRFSEGYGMNCAMVDEIEKGLVITVDNGIAAIEPIEKAKGKGLTVLVTDHHLPVVDGNVMTLPVADCIINPHVEELTGEPGYDFYDYCGTGVALKIAEQLIPDKQDIIDKLYSFAAVATIADVVPLLEDNRNIYIRGAENIHNLRMSEGLKQLFAQNKINIADIPDGLEPHHVITPDIMGFRIAPCINAASRMYDDGAVSALYCLMSDKDKKGAYERAAMLLSVNDKRKTLTATETKEIQTQIDKSETKCPIVVHIPDSGPGIIGLHAGRITEEYGVPSIVFNGHGVCKGSGRAPEGVHLKNMLDECREYLETYGGHAGAAGLTIKEKNIDAFRKAFEDVCRQHNVHPLDKSTVKYDLEIHENEIDETCEALKMLAPFGEGNPEPFICVDDFRPAEIKVIGGKHLKLTGESGIEALQWGVAEKGIPDGIEEGKNIAAVGTLGFNIWNGKARPQMVISLIDEGRKPLITEYTHDREK